MNPDISTQSTITELVRRVRVLLLDFDGPVCKLFSGYPAPGIASGIYALAQRRGCHLAEATTDPLVLLRAAYKYSPELGRAVEMFVIEHETRAAMVAEPTPGSHQTIRAAVVTGRSVLIVSNNSERAIRSYLTRHSLTDCVSQVVGRPFARPAQMKPAPDLLVAALDIARATTSNAVFVGDSITDLLAGNAAGVATIGYAKAPERYAGLAENDAVLVLDSMTLLAKALEQR